MKTTLIAALLLCAAAPAAPQGDMRASGYRELELHASDEIVSTFSGRIEYITGAEMTLIADEEKDTLPLKADRVEFAYADDETTVPSRILLTGNVRIDHPEGRITADRVDMDFDGGEAIFTGSPAMYNDRFPEGFFGDSIILDLDSEEVRVKNGHSPRMILTTADPAAKMKLTAADIRDWPEFLNELKRQDAAGNSPGNHIVGLLDAVVQNAVRSNSTDVILQQRDGIVKLFNGLLAKADFYDPAAWSGYEVTQAAVEQLRVVEGQTKAAVVWANRQLLRDAFRAFVNAPPKLAPPKLAPPELAP